MERLPLCRISGEAGIRYNREDVDAFERECAYQKATDIACMVQAYEKDLIQEALGTTGGNISEAAKLLRIPRQTLQRKVKQYEIQPRRP